MEAARERDALDRALRRTSALFRRRAAAHDVETRMRVISRMKGRFFLLEKYPEESDEYNEIVKFRRHWESCYGDDYGSFEGTTVVPPMLYTFGPTPRYAIPDYTMQIFSIKVAHLKEGLQWPLHVYGMIATRDSIDPRRNLLFHRTRDNCQTITEGVPYLLLTGPSRAVVLIDPITFEVQLKARGRTESEDKELCFNILTTQHASGYVGGPPRISTRYLCCNQSKLEFAFAVLTTSVEAAIRVEIVDGSWPEHLGVVVTARTASIDHARILLLDSQVGTMPISGSGAIQLSRQVVCVELSGELKIDVVAFQVGDGNVYSDVAKGSVVFTPKEAAISSDKCDLGFCKLSVTVGWSLLAPVEHEPWDRPVLHTHATPSSKDA